MHKLRGGTPFGRPLRHRSQAMGITQSQVTKNMANGHVRRGRPLTSQTAFGGQLPYKGSLVRPAVRFGHSQSEYNGKVLRATNYEPRATSHEPRFFPQVESHSRRCYSFEFVAAKRHLSPRRHANCGLRPAGPSGSKFDERRTTYDERSFPRPTGPNLH